MKSLLYPAVALTNRLSFGMKFSLISVLFFFPMLARLQNLTAMTNDPEQVSVFDGKRDEMITAFKAQQAETSLQSKSALIGKLLGNAQIFSQIIGGFYATTRTTLKRLGGVMDKVAAGDMTITFTAHSRDELGELGNVFNGTVAKIHDLIELVGKTVNEVERQASQVETVSARSNQAVAGQRTQIEQVATVMNQMSATAQEVARSAAAAVSSAHSVNDETISGRGLVESQQGSKPRWPTISTRTLSRSTGPVSAPPKERTRPSMPAVHRRPKWCS